MKAKIFLTNSLIAIASTGFSLIIISFVLELVLSSKYIWNQKYEAVMIETKRELEVDYPEKIRSAVNGFKPLYYPRKTRNLFLNSKYYPVGTLPKTPTFYCNEGYGLVTFNSDRFGLRNEDSKWDDIQNKGATFIGDSFTQGACVDTQFTFGIVSNLDDKKYTQSRHWQRGPYSIFSFKILVKPILTFSNKNFIVIVFYDNDNKN